MHQFFPQPNSRAPRANSFSFLKSNSLPVDNPEDVSFTGTFGVRAIAVVVGATAVVVGDATVMAGATVVAATAGGETATSCRSGGAAPTIAASAGDNGVCTPIGSGGPTLLTPWSPPPLTPPPPQMFLRTWTSLPLGNCSQMSRVQSSGTGAAKAVRETRRRRRRKGHTILAD